MNQLKDWITSVVIILEETATLFYQQKRQEAYAKLLQGIDELTIIIGKLDEIPANDSLNIDKDKLLNTLMEAMHALEDRDTVLIADILQYDLINRLKEICDIL